MRREGRTPPEAESAADGGAVAAVPQPPAEQADGHANGRTDAQADAQADAAADAAADAPAERRYTHRQIIEILVGLMLAMLTSMLTTSIVGTALPTIIGELGGQDKLSWVASATLLTMTASTPLWGKLSDIWGRKLLFQIALVIFITSSVAAGFATDIYWLIGARAIQGIGAGGLAALPQIILGDVVEPRERGRYSGFLGAVFGVSTVAGPLLGGFLVDSPLGWRWCFFITVPLAVVAFIVIQRMLKLPQRPRGDARLDWWGATCIVGAASALMLVLSLGGKEFAWNSVPTYLFFAAAAVLAALAVAAEIRAHDPILPPRLFRNRTFIFASLTSMAIGMSMFGVMIYFPQYLQIVRGMSPTASGLMTLPMVLGLLAASISSGFLVSRTGHWKVFPVVGTLLVAAGYLTLTRVEEDSGLALVGAGVCVIGLGLGLSMQILILATQNALERADMAAATSAVSFFRNLGGAVGVAAFGAIMTHELRTGLAPLMAKAGPGAADAAAGSPEAIQALPPQTQQLIVGVYGDAMHAVFIAGIPIALVGFVMVLFLKQVPLRSGRD
ncbi:EmrB/QacA subfamily drug resistance transporter [Murinocardiopsis flavida]|uniref:EmrB/QacA subfamily drug resistance transporter n=1 Tax=Murinocardiopsis flavida TaxID=645275 RepID=A0A2P8DQM4_9ACTN|nr:MDR family MFS transporter [Murinocardiopsis flavida]PSK99526.1 EmrB/QacA subfamily drug resistance transporter [Murinocardiopsis flavida]